ncbi:MAG: hypothetical protein HWE20_05075 [Gammaproteobacteria bacterium]|nr:hypothetical protein [Gammaproteobacteria bacterium]
MQNHRQAGFTLIVLLIGLAVVAYLVIGQTTPKQSNATSNTALLMQSAPANMQAKQIKQQLKVLEAARQLQLEQFNQ